MSFGSDDDDTGSVTLAQLLQERMDADNLSLRAVCDVTQVSYSVLMGVVRDRSVPRREEDRLALREWLGVSERDWSVMIAAGAGSGEETGSLLTLQQLVTRALYHEGLTEQELSRRCDIPYATLMGVTRKGAVPRQQTLNAMARVLNLQPDEVASAVRVTRVARRGVSVQQLQTGRVAKTPSLVTLVLERAQANRQSVAAFSQAAGLGYLVVSRMIEHQKPPALPADQHLLREALDLDEATFNEACAAIGEEDDDVGDSSSNVFVASGTESFANGSGTPLQQALHSMMRSGRLTIKELARRANLSQVTMSRLLKDGQPPARAKTHQNLQRLLGLTADAYHAFLEQSRKKYERPLSVAKPETATIRQGEEKVEAVGDGYQPHDALEPRRDDKVSEQLLQVTGRLTKAKRARLLEMAEELAAESNEFHVASEKSLGSDDETTSERLA
jgi:transcriptional regulator with XRE-family HTH domain